MILQASNGPANWENSTRSKWNNSILCLTLHVPRNISQRRGKCHNPILTLRIFPGFHHTNWGNSINARTCWKYPNMLKSVNLRPRFKDMRILTSLTKFDYVWPSLTKVWPEPWLSSIRTWLIVYRHLKEHMKTFSLVAYRPKTDLRRRSYGRNLEKRRNT